VAETNRRNPTSSFNRLLPVGINSREKNLIMAYGGRTRHSRDPPVPKRAS
jgi:hypothetical protein